MASRYYARDMPHRLSATALAAGLLFASGCATPAPVTPQHAVDQLRARTGAAPRLDGTLPPGVPAGINLDDGVASDEAVAVALWNNAAFQVAVSDLGFARADLIEAGLLTNPVLSLLFPLGPKQLESTLRWPVEVLWQRPRRVAAARLAADAVAERLIQAGLDLVLSVRVAHTDLDMAIRRERLATEIAALAGRIATHAATRLDAGDISALDARAAQIDAAGAAQHAQRAAHDVTMARERLRLLLGLTGRADALNPTPPAATLPDCGSTPDLRKTALAARPDVRAAEIGVEAAAAKLGWEKSRVLALTAVLDANGQGREGFEAGPGLDVGLPLFSRNQGGRARAEAELQRASATYLATQQRASFEVQEALTQLEQRGQWLAGWRTAVVAPLQENQAGTERQFAAGDVSALAVLDYQRRLMDAQLRELELQADLMRDRARLERAIGRSCGAPFQENTRDR